MRRHGAASEAAWAFARLEDLWKGYRPLTPLGKDEAEARQVLTDRAAIEAALDRTEAVAAWLASPEVPGPDRDRVAWHLRRVPRLPSLVEGEVESKEAGLDILELFQVKKFLANYRAVRALLPEGLVQLFGLGFPFQELSRALDGGGSDPETFFISDSYGEGLPEIRAALRELDATIEAERGARAEEARTRFGIDFQGLDFVLLGHGRSRLLLAEEGLFSVDPWDDESCSLRLRPTATELQLLARREGLLAEEARREARVVAALSRLARAAGQDLLGAARALGDFDCARARAILMDPAQACRPSFGPPRGSLMAEKGRFLPCKEECRGLGMDYTALDLSLAEAGAVIFGSNMGGKTVALQSLMFFQILAQLGFHVPAASYATSIWPLLHYVGQGGGALGEGGSGGLSGFGSEVRSFVEAMAETGALTALGEGAAFLVFDEFARTTSSHEAEALLSAILADLVARPGIRFLLSTHFTSVARIPGVRYLRVRGLDREAARRAMGMDEALGERIRRINSLMAYGLVDEGRGGREGSDAIAIASLLGLAPGLVAAAEAHYSGTGIDVMDDIPSAEDREIEKP